MEKGTRDAEERSGDVSYLSISISPFHFIPILRHGIISLGPLHDRKINIKNRLDIECPNPGPQNH